MSPTFRRLEVKDLGDLARLVGENIEGIEPSLRVIDSRLLLGQAVIDLVALDGRDSLVLVALDFTAENGLLFRVMDAYAWCLEYPDTLRRLYPMANVASTRPPRILCIVERLTDAFVRRITQLSFLEIDCLEFRHLEVNGASAVHFDLVKRLRREGPVEPAWDNEKVITTAPVRTPKRIEAEPPVVEPAWPLIAAPHVEPSSVEPALFVAPEPAPPIGAGASAAPEPSASLETHMAEFLAEPSGAETPTEEDATEEAHAGADADAVAEGPALRLESVNATANPERPALWQALLSQLGIELNERKASGQTEAPVETNAAVVEPVAPAPVETAAPAKTPPAWAKRSADKVMPPSSGRAAFASPAAKGPAPAAAQTAKPAATPAPAAAALAQKTAAPEQRIPATPNLMSAARVKAILVVDDDPTVGKVLGDILRADGHRVTTARNGVQALALLTNQVFDLLLVDVRMPELEGPALYRVLEQHNPEHAHRVMFMTGGAVDAETGNILATMRTPLLRKPLQVEELRIRVQQFFLAADSFVAAAHRESAARGPSGRGAPPDGP